MIWAVRTWVMQRFEFVEVIIVGSDDSVLSKRGKMK